MLGDIITSKTRIRLLTRFDSKLISHEKAGRHILYRANEQHPLFPELHSMVQKSLGMDQVIESVLNRLGDLEEAYLIDDYAAGRDTGIIDLLLVGHINQYHLNDLSRKTERYIGRKIRSLVLTRDEFTNLESKLKQRPHLLLWNGTSCSHASLIER